MLTEEQKKELSASNYLRIIAEKLGKHIYGSQVKGRQHRKPSETLLEIKEIITEWEVSWGD